VVISGRNKWKISFKPLWKNYFNKYYIFFKMDGISGATATVTAETEAEVAVAVKEVYIVLSQDDIDIDITVAKYYKKDDIYTWKEFQDLIYEDIIPMLREMDCYNPPPSFTRNDLIEWVGAFGPYEEYYHALMVRDRQIRNVIPSPLSSPNLSPLPSFLDVSSTGEITSLNTTVDQETNDVFNMFKPEDFIEGEVFPNFSAEINPCKKYFIEYHTSRKPTNVNNLPHIFDYN
jgi:hypothetical protein